MQVENRAMTVGCPSLDREHEGIQLQMSFISEFLTHHGETDSDRPLLLDGLSDMMLLVADHFAHEEALLELSGYPLLAEHRKTHQMIALRIQELVQKAKIGSSLLALRQEIQYLDIWFVTHFNTTDQLYRGQVEDVPDSAMR